MSCLSSEIRFWDEKVLGGTGKTTLTTRQLNFKYSITRGWGID